MLLTSLAFFNQLHGVFEHYRSIIPLSQGLCCQGPSSSMVATDAFMHLSEHIFGVFLSNAFKDGCREASFIKGPPMNGEPSRPHPELGGLLWIAWQCFVHQVVPDGVHLVRLGHYPGHFFIVDVHRGFWEVLDRYSLSRSFCGAVAGFAKAFALVFFALETYLT